ncbi:HK97 gp10 family phage protein [Phyllobacterium salinisoli]|uniref:HK97 gp10 family phage protein n=1 Tax=Phyllobacterium salinisoli TaxID=1899321 RepID=A0A368K918_9HYPH|nr:HK97-gp10 family putative phage morphogenesis protein [Phyllobacterium salinisoli]RCS25839.1 HK97 gp10 family phage protein [Phyllobacterium salinisoli]
MASDRDRMLRLKRRMLDLPKSIREAASRATLEGAEELAASIRNLAPVDSGALRDSIVVTPGGQTTPPYSQPGGSQVVSENAAVVTVGNTDARYPHLVEYGTKDTTAQPFFWPAVRSKRKRLAARIKRQITKAAKEEWKGK